MADRITELQRELLAICRGGSAFETWARVSGVPMNEQRDWSGRMSRQARVDEIRREIHALNPDAALYFGWGPDEHPQAQEHFLKCVLANHSGVSASGGETLPGKTTAGQS